MIPALLAAAAFGLLTGALWVRLRSGATDAVSTNIFGRLVMILTALSIAIVFGGRRPASARLFGTGVALLLLYIPMAAFLLARPASASSPEFVMILFLREGCFSAGYTICAIEVVRMLAGFPTQAGVVSVALGYALSEAVYFASLAASVESLNAVRLALTAAGIVAALAFFRILGRREPVEGRRPTDPPQLVADPGDVPALFRNQETVLLLVGTTLFPFLFCVMAELLTQLGFAEVGLYDAPNEIAAIGGLCLLVMLSTSFRHDVSYGNVLSLCIPLYATGFLLLPLAWGTSPYFPQVFVKVGFALYQDLFWIILMEKVRRNPDNALFHLGFFFAYFQVFKMLGRLLVPSLVQALGTGTLLWGLSVVSLYLIALYALAFFLITKYWHPEIELDYRSGAQAPGAEARAAGDGGHEARPPYVTRFCDAYDLPERQREVLYGIVRGYSLEVIADRLFVSPSTVKTHLQRIYRKANVNSKQELIERMERFDDGGNGSSDA